MASLTVTALRAFLATAVVIFSLTAARWVEYTWMPVNTDWLPVQVWEQNGDLFVSGTMIRRRNGCEYAPPPRAKTMDGEHLRVISHSPTSTLSWSADPKPNAFGPWQIVGGAGKHILFYQEHRCHFAWSQITILGEIDNRKPKR